MNIHPNNPITILHIIPDTPSILGNGNITAIKIHSIPIATINIFFNLLSLNENHPLSHKRETHSLIYCNIYSWRINCFIK